MGSSSGDPYAAVRRHNPYVILSPTGYRTIKGKDELSLSMGVNGDFRFVLGEINVARHSRTTGGVGIKK